MKGLVFTEFFEMVEDNLAPELVDQMIENANLPSNGAYTSVGNYDYREMVELVSQLSTLTDVPVPELLRTFGKHLFGRFATLYPQFFEGIDTTFDALESVDGHIHVEVRKLYPNADFPSLECNRPEPGRMVLLYRSERPFADFAEGLIIGCAKHFEEKIDIQQEYLSNGERKVVRFTLTQNENDQ
ncbi:MAG: heme NO-binding domain-containing protein [bacterium]